MQIILMRHVEAVPFGQIDQERSLTPNGKVQAIQTANKLKRANVNVAKVICSTLLRARETAEIVGATLAPHCVVQSIAGITPNDAYDSALTEIQSHGRDGTLVVFHQPILSHIVSWLTHGSLNADLYPIPVTATAYVLSLDEFAPRSAILRCAYQP